MVHVKTSDSEDCEDSEGEEKNAAPNRGLERGKCGPTELKVLTLGRNTSFWAKFNMATGCWACI